MIKKTAEFYLKGNKTNLQMMAYSRRFNYLCQKNSLLTKE